GDSATVVFRGEGFALRAAAAAVKAQELIDGIAVGSLSTPLRLRVGVGGGLTRLLVVGDEIQRMVLAGGEASKLALKAQSRAEPGTTLLDERLAAAMGDRIVVGPTRDGMCELRAVDTPPEAAPIVPLEPGIEDQVEEKIALLEPFVPAPLAARLKQMPDGWRIEGELRRVVVVFAEVSGFERSNEQIGFEVARDVLRCHRRYGGVQFKFDLTSSGHRTLSLFGLHAPTENDSERAVLAAIELSGLVRSAAAQHPEIELRIGIHVGEVYFGAIGSSYRYDITVIGDVVNIAARAAAAGPAFGVVVTEAVLGELSEDFSSEALDPIRFKGKSEPMMLHTVQGASGRQARYVQKRRSRRHLAGRQAQLEILEDARKSALKGRGRVIGVVGEAGTGKSCLLADVIDDWLEAGAVGALGRCTFVTRTEPLAPVRSMLTNFVGLSEGDENPVATVQRSLGSYRLGEGTEALVRFLAGKGPNGQGTDGVADDQSWQQVLGAVERFVLQRVAEVPVLYILEDVHLADSLTSRLIYRLAQVSRKHRFLFIVTYRSDPSLVDLRELLDEEIALDNLHLRDAADLVGTLFGADQVDDEVAGFLWERTEGNPGRLTELTNFLRDRGLLRNHAQTVVAPPPGLELLKEVVPSNMAQFALGRLEHLGEVERRLLRIAATIGRSFERDVLAQVAQSLDEGDIDFGVVSLIDEGVISPEASRRPSYRFREEITRAVTYSTIPESERRDYHRRIADVLEKLSDTDVERSAVTLAQHRERAHQLAEAVRWYERAIRLVVFAGLDEETRYLIGQWERVVGMLPPDERPKLRTMANMAVRKLVATARHGLSAEAVELAQGLADAYGRSLEAHERAVVDLWSGAALLGTGKKSAARRALKSAFDKSADNTSRCDAAIYLFKAYGGIDVESSWWLDRASELVKPGTSQALRVELARACQVADRGKLDEARIINARVRDEARRKDQLRIAAIAASNLADCDLVSGDVAHALAGFEEAVVMARALGTRSDDAIDQLNLGICHLFGGDADRAVRHLESALAISSEVGHAGTETEATVHLGLALALSDDIEQGERLVESGMERAEPGGFVHDSGLLHLLHIAILRRDLPLVDERLKAVLALDRSSLPPLLQRTLRRLSSRADELEGTIDE
ncbi:MAG: AAA family ATPase, partial [Deltaproteobacteria bacterium]|nr:AAA family ATPase [Deltaproteobacteria bacterium]